MSRISMPNRKARKRNDYSIGTLIDVLWGSHFGNVFTANILHE